MSDTRVWATEAIAPTARNWSIDFRRFLPLRPRENISADFSLLNAMVDILACTGTMRLPPPACAHSHCARQKTKWQTAPTRKHDASSALSGGGSIKKSAHVISHFNTIHAGCHA